MKKIYFLFLMALLPLLASAVVKRTINVATAGTLPDLISDVDKHRIQKLTLTGELNGTDIKFIREMAGDTVAAHPNVVGYGKTNGQLVSLDISNCIIVEGGTAYYWTKEYNEYLEPYLVSYKTEQNSISDYMFARIYSSNQLLKEIILPNSVSSIGKMAFSGRIGLSSITIPQSVTFISSGAFSGCIGLSSITIPKGVTSIGSGAFSGCSGLTFISVEKGNTVYNSQNNCNAIIETASGVLLAGCKNTVIPNSVTSIGDCAFCGCIGLTSVTIPQSVTSIGSSAFSGCTSLESVTIPNSVTSIGSSAFSGCTSLESATIPNSVISIDGSTFYGCSGLTSVTIPNSVTSIGDYAFSDCSGLTSVTIPNSVTSIGRSAFSSCTSLESVTIPNSVICISEYAFYNTRWYDNQPDGVVYAGKVFYEYKGTMPKGTKISIKNGTLGIAGGAFYNCTGLTSVTIPNSVTSIGKSAFYECTGLTSVSIPNSVTSIGDFAFLGCYGLTSVSIPSNVTSIGYGAFRNCSGLTSVYTSDIDAWCNISFASYDSNPLCYAQHLFVNKTEITKLTIPNSVTSIGDYAFYNCSDLTSIIIPNSVTSIGNSAFSGCSNLTSVTIPNSVTSIGDGAFSGCSGMTFVTIPGSVTSIGSYAFWGCKALTNVYCYAESVPTTQSYSFDTSYIPNVTLHVPTGSVDAYKAVEPWSKFKEIVGTTAKVKLNKTKATLEKGNTLTLKATVTPSTLPDKSVTWKSSNTKVATVTSSGKVKGVKAGTATITCTYVATGAKATCKVTVGYVSLNESKVAIQKGKTVTLTPTVYPSSLTDKSVTWQSTDTKVATVTSGGKVKGVKAGTAIIICTSVATSLSAICEVTVGSVSLNKSKAFLEKGKTVTLKATVQSTVSDDKSVVWESSDKSIATVSSTGKVKGVKYGTATITCTSNATGVSATCKVTVGKVVINMSEFTLKKSRSVTLVATVYPTTLTDKSVKWTSSDKSIATVTSDGKVKGIAVGTATITCTSVATGLKSTCTVTVLATTESRSTEGDDDNVTGIENLEEAPVATEPFDVYDLSGRKVRHQVNSLDGLPDGIYIVNGKKILKK